MPRVVVSDMMAACRARFGRALFPLLLIVACVRPALAQANVQGPEPSTIVVPIRASLAPLVPEIEARVPKTFADKATERGIDVRYEVERAPIQLRMIGGGLHSSTAMKYALEACRGRFPCISCGFGEARRVADIKLHSKLEWDAAWRIRSVTRPLPVHYAKRCEVTWLGIDITHRFVAPVVESQLRETARTIDRNTPAHTNIRPQAEQIWTALQTPVELAPRTWLVLEPRDVALTPISGSGAVVTSTLLLRAQTRVVVGERPVMARRPLPALKTGTAQPGSIRVPFDLQLPYEEASRLATRDFAGKTYRVDGKPLIVESIRLAPAAKGKVLVEAQIDYRGGALRNYRGLVFLEGTPRFDPATKSIVVPDLEYSIDPKRRGFFQRIVDRAAHASIRGRLRESARFDLGPRITEARAEITRALTRDLGRGVRMRGTADAIEPASVTAMADAIHVHVIATGRADIEWSAGVSPAGSAASRRRD
jgi:Domain of unknown function (DUF4403)